MGARVAHGEGAHLLEVNEGVVAILPGRCDATRSTHLPAGAARAVVSTGSKLEGPQGTSGCMRDEGVIWHEQFDQSPERGPFRAVPHLSCQSQWCPHLGPFSGSRPARASWRAGGENPRWWIASPCIMRRWSAAFGATSFAAAWNRRGGETRSIAEERSLAAGTESAETTELSS